MMELMRQTEIFKPSKFQKKRLDIIGVGATGSYVVWLLAKIGLANIHIWDDDIIHDHNIPNQCFFLKHEGKTKVEALAEMVKEGSGTKIVLHKEKVDGSRKFGQIVFLLTDTMESRKEIWNTSLKYKLNVECVIETRMGADSGRIYTIHPSKPSHIKQWEATLYDDKEAEVSACGTSISIAPTASLIASIAVWQLIKWFNGQETENEIIISCRPWTIVSRKF